jgi:hypothetical protein
MTVADLKVGDVAYVLSGRQNSFFEARVTHRDETGVQVYLGAKYEHQWYYNNGLADAEADEKDGVPRATLVTVDDPRIEILKLRKAFKAHHKAVQDATNEFRRDPTFDNSQALLQAALNWSDFAATHDPYAIRAESIQEYQDLVSAANNKES